MPGTSYEEWYASLPPETRAFFSKDPNGTLAYDPNATGSFNWLGGLAIGGFDNETSGLFGDVWGKVRNPDGSLSPETIYNVLYNPDGSRNKKAWKSLDPKFSPNNPFENGGGGSMAKKGKQTPVLTPEQLKLLQSITGQVGGDVAGGQGFGLDPLAEGAYGNLADMFGANGEFGDLGREAGLKLLRGEQLIPYNDPGREQFYKDAFLDPAMRDFNEDILPAISEAYAGKGLERSGDVLRAFTNSGERLATSLSGQRAELLRGDQDRALLGLGQAFGAAATPQEIAFNTGQQNRFLQNPYSNPAYGIAPLALGTQPYAVRARSGASNKGSNIGAGIGAGLGVLSNLYGGGSSGGFSSGGGGSSGIIWN